MKLIGDRIRELRKEKGLTLFALAMRTGLDQGLLSKYERGVSIPGHDNLKKIASGLDLSLETLIDDVELKRRAVVA